jgi:hypothetical protein
VTRGRGKWINLYFHEMRDIGEADIVRKFRAQKRDLAQRRLSEGVRRHAGRGTVRHTIDMVNLGPGQDVGYTLTLTLSPLGSCSRAPRRRVVIGSTPANLAGPVFIASSANAPRKRNAALEIGIDTVAAPVDPAVTCCGGTIDRR